MRSRKIEHKILEQDAAVPFVTRDSAAVGIGDDCVAEPHGDLPFRKRISDWQHPLPFKFVDLFAGIG
ncbi:MAG TPA: hypothetical protein PLP42_03770, partial [Acidobacteriota bacterium]|nr:hypothetical protein [Acidobacteriota bacterium]